MCGASRELTNIFLLVYELTKLKFEDQTDVPVFYYMFPIVKFYKLTQA